MELSSWILPAGVAVLLVLVVVSVVRIYRRRPSTTGLEDYVAGLSRLIDGDEDQAYRHMLKAAQSGFQDSDLYLRMGDILRRRGKAQQALQTHLGLTVKADLAREEKARVLSSLAEDYAALGRIKESIETLEELSRTHGDSPDLRRRLAHEYFRAGDVQKAFKTLSQQAKKSGGPSDADLATFLAAAAEDLAGTIDDASEEALREARRLLSRALKLDPNTPAALRLRGELSSRSGDLDQAVESWIRLAVVEPELGPGIYRRLEKLLFEKGRFDEIGKVYREVLAGNPGDEEAALGLAAFQVKRGVPTSAAQVLDSFPSANTPSPKISAALALLHLRQDDKDSAEEVLRRQLDHQGKPSGYRCSTCGTESDKKRWYCSNCGAYRSYVFEGRPS